MFMSGFINIWNTWGHAGCISELSQIYDAWPIDVNIAEKIQKTFTKCSFVITALDYSERY